MSDDSGVVCPILSHPHVDRIIYIDNYDANDAIVTTALLAIESQGFPTVCEVLVCPSARGSPWSFLGALCL